MRIFILTILFISGFYYFSPRETKKLPEIDSIRLKMGAPDRAERILTVEKTPALAIANEDSGSVQAPPADRETEEVVGATPAQEDDQEHVETVHWTELEEGWNHELKEMITRLEPVEGENMHKAYLAEQESYQAEMDSLMNEGHQDTTHSSYEIEQLMTQLEYKHQEKLKSIFGPHYESVRDHYEYFMDASPTDDSE